VWAPDGGGTTAEIILLSFFRSFFLSFFLSFFQSLAFEKNLYPHTRPITLTGVMQVHSTEPA
jgi:hypothetical protein